MKKEICGETGRNYQLMAQHCGGPNFMKKVKRPNYVD